MAGYTEKTDLISYWLTSVGLFLILDLFFVLWVFWLDISNNPNNLYMVEALTFGLLKVPYTVIFGIPLAIIFLFIAIVWFSPWLDTTRTRVYSKFSRKERPK